MGAKTYLIGWMSLLIAIQRYGGRWQAKMGINLTTEQQACVASVLSTVAECLIAFGPRPVE